MLERQISPWILTSSGHRMPSMTVPIQTITQCLTMYLIGGTEMVHTEEIMQGQVSG